MALNKSKQGAFFLSKLWLVTFLSNHGARYIKKTGAQVLAACTTECPVDFAVFVNAFCNEAVAICCENVPYLQETNSMHLSNIA